MASILGGGLPPLSVQDMLENSGRLVDKFLQDDRSYLDLSEQLQIPSHSKHKAGLWNMNGVEGDFTVAWSTAHVSCFDH